MPAGLGPTKGRSVDLGRWNWLGDSMLVWVLGCQRACASAHGYECPSHKLVTGTDPEHWQDADTAPSGLARLKAAGFKTAWISNQDLTVFKENGHDYVWVGATPTTRYRHDDVMLPIVEAFAAPLIGPDDAMNQAPRGIVMHMLGSHFEYAERYPSKRFDPEPASLSTTTNCSELRYERANEYGRAHAHANRRHSRSNPCSGICDIRFGPRRKLAGAIANGLTHTSRASHFTAGWHSHIVRNLERRLWGDGQCGSYSIISGNRPTSLHTATCIRPGWRCRESTFTRS